MTLTEVRDRIFVAGLSVAGAALFIGVILLANPSVPLVWLDVTYWSGWASLMVVLASEACLGGEAPRW
ncbi:hypothetical protein K0U83_04210 [bacterium]|nr:hypothetical protein [bacterium]